MEFTRRIVCKQKFISINLWKDIKKYIKFTSVCVVIHFSRNELRRFDKWIKKQMLFFFSTNAVGVRWMQFASSVSGPQKALAFLFGDNAVRLHVDAVRPPDRYSSLGRFWVREERSSAFLVESTQLLNHKKLERVLYIQMERIDGSYPTVYQLHRSDERIKKNYTKTPAVHKRAAHRFQNSFKTVKNLEKCSTCWRCY